MVIKHTRTPVTTKEILKYLKLKTRRLEQGTTDERIPKREQEIQKIRLSELDKLIDVIVNDKVLEVNKKIQKSLYGRPKASLEPKDL